MKEIKVDSLRFSIPYAQYGNEVKKVQNYKQKVEGGENIEFLNPAQTENGFYVESGWTSIGNKIKVPNKNSTWIIEGNKTLTDKTPVTLKWNNNEGVIFKKKIE